MAWYVHLQVGMTLTCAVEDNMLLLSYSWKLLKNNVAGLFLAIRSNSASVARASEDEADVNFATVTIPSGLSVSTISKGQ